MSDQKLGASEPVEWRLVVTVGPQFAFLQIGQHVDVPSAGGLHLVRDVWHNVDRSVRLTLERIAVLEPHEGRRESELTARRKRSGNAGHGLDRAALAARYTEMLLERSLRVGDLAWLDDTLAQEAVRIADALIAELGKEPAR